MLIRGWRYTKEKGRIWEEINNSSSKSDFTGLCLVSARASQRLLSFYLYVPFLLAPRSLSPSLPLISIERAREDMATFRMVKLSSACQTRGSSGFSSTGS
ncbi:hypothetical protein RRG08_047118 [Elysia crispata]|uniref:Uncharacterized protein n=1 Tax=Elysia crispata TaxID=231223 RepID=A0AAE1ANP1_9GAST|nr:hypothetical protein RRG08_047118 [Elysia crispata]